MFEDFEITENNEEKPNIPSDEKASKVDDIEPDVNFEDTSFLQSSENSNFENDIAEINAIIAENFPELQFLMQQTSPKNRLDLEEINKTLTEDSQVRTDIPDPKTEIMNDDANRIEFAGYNSTEIAHREEKKAQEQEKESYEEWLSQHKAIVMSSRKENRQSKAPSLKNVKESEPTKFIKLDVNAVLNKSVDHEKQAEDTLLKKQEKTAPKVPMASAIPIDPASEQNKDIEFSTHEPILQFKVNSYPHLQKSINEETTKNMKIKDRKPKTQIIPNSPAPMPETSMTKKKSFDEKLKNTKKDNEKKDQVEDSEDSNDIFGMPPAPED